MSAVKTLTALAISGGLLAGAAPAYALSATTTGAYASSSGAKITLKDTLADAHPVRAEWYRTGSSSKIDLENRSGSGTTVTYTTGGIVHLLRVCRDTTFRDNCSTWVS